jgi:hypothetical protein
MKILSSKTHGVLDYATIFFLALSPSLFNMSSPGNEVAYTLAFVHLALTLLTRFELGAFRIIPLWLHGIIELCVSILLFVLTLWFGIWNDGVSFYFYTTFSVVLFFVWFISDYKLPSNRAKLFS